MKFTVEEKRDYELVVCQAPYGAHSQKARQATADDVIAALKADVALQHSVLAAFVPASLLQGLAGNEARNEAHRQQLPPGFGMVGRNCKEGGQ